MMMPCVMVEAEQALPPALLRLSRLADLARADVDAVRAAIAGPTRMAARTRDLASDGCPIDGPLLVVDGWAARVRVLSDGRRQLLSLLLPGDLVGWPDHASVASSPAIALTSTIACAAPPVRHSGSPLARAYARARMLDETYLFNQIVRLGRLTAYERIGSLLMELHERLGMAGLIAEDRFRLPLTQEMIADLTGLTSVHVNRTLQAMRRDGTIALTGGILHLTNPAALAEVADHRPTPMPG